MVRMISCSPKGLKDAGEAIKGGKVVIYPTDTVYGIGGDPFNRETVRRIFELKRREVKPMPVLVASREKAKGLVETDRLSLFLMDNFWPGALTIVLRTKVRLPSQLTGGVEKLGVRMPNHNLALGLIEASGGALIGTSANISGKNPARTVEELDLRLVQGADLVLDGKVPTSGIPSTVVEVMSRGRGDHVRIIREGSIGAGVIREKLLEAGMRTTGLA